MKKRTSIVLLTICLLLSLLTFGAAADEPTTKLPEEVTTDTFDDNVIYFNGTYYADIKSALEAANASAGADPAVLYFKPDANVTSYSHMHVARSMTIYGNGAVISGGEQDFELDTYDTGGSITSDVTLTIYNLNGASVWGQRKSTHSLNITLENCNNVGKVYISGASGANNITLKNCTFDNTKMTHPNCAVYSNAAGTILIEGCSFKDVPECINLNNKSAAGTEQNITVRNCTFNNCSTTDICTSDLTYAAPIRVLSSNGAVSKLNVENCTFTVDEGKTTCNGDILLGDGRVGETSYPTVYLSVSGTDAEVQVQNPGDRTSESSTPSSTIEVSETESIESFGTAAAKVGDKYYTELHDAMEEAVSGDTVELLRDITVETWEQVWNITGITLEGNGHTLTVNAITSGQNHDTVFHSAGGNTFRNLTIDLSGISVASQAQGYKAICAAPGDSFDNITVISGATVPVYGIFVGGTDAEDETITITNCKFENCCYAVGAQPTTGTDSNLENLVVTDCTFKNCDYVGILYATDVTFTGNSVDSGKLNIMHPNQTVTGNSFTDGSRIKFYTNEATFEKNSVSADSKLDANTGVSDIDVSKNYWGGGAPSAEQLNGVSVTGSGEFYLDPSMDEEDLNTYVPPYTVTIVYGNGQANVVTNHKLNDQIPLPAAPTKSGYIFMGWKCGGEVYAASETVTVTGNMTFYAVWANMPDVGPTVPDEPVKFPFTDVSTGSWYYDAVYYVWENGLMNGTDTYKFSPNSPLTRAMVWAVLARIDGVKIEGDTWMTDAQKWAVAKGVSDGTNPTGYITREQLVTMLWRYKGSPAVEYSLTAPDASGISDWAVDAMKWAASIGLIEGDETGALNPASNSTRAHAATFFMRFCK